MDDIRVRETVGHSGRPFRQPLRPIGMAEGWVFVIDPRYPRATPTAIRAREWFGLEQLTGEHSPGAAAAA